MIFLWNSWNGLTKMRRKKKKEKTLSVHWGKAVLIATGSNLLDTKYEFYGFNNDLRDTIN